MLALLPPEIIFNIISFMSCKDMSSLRLVSKTLRTFCDYPTNWRAIYLRNNITGQLWKLAELKEIIDPHLSDIRSISIWGVRDNIVQYLLSSCRNLENLTICGWNTLSDHSLQLPPSQTLKIKTFKLIGSSLQTNFVSIDAYALGNLLARSPQMTSIVFGCDTQIHAETLITELEKKTQSKPSLTSFILASRRTWLNEHVLRLIKVYPCLQSIYLLSSEMIGSNAKDSNIADLMFKKAGEYINYPPSSIEDTQKSLISTEDMILYNRF
jgi:hypothetical protein